MMDFKFNIICALGCGLVSCMILLGVDAYRINSLKKEYYQCSAQIEVQNAAIALKQKQDDELNKRLVSAEKSYSNELNEQKKRAAEIDRVPIIDDCTGAVKWGSERAAAIAATWVDRD